MFRETHEYTIARRVDFLFRNPGSGRRFGHVAGEGRDGFFDLTAAYFHVRNFLGNLSGLIEDDRDRFTNVADRLLGLPRQFLDFRRDDAESASRFAGACASADPIRYAVAKGYVVSSISVPHHVAVSHALEGPQ